MTALLDPVADLLVLLWGKRDLLKVLPDTRWGDRLWNDGEAFSLSAPCNEDLTWLDVVLLCDGLHLVGVDEVVLLWVLG